MSPSQAEPVARLGPSGFDPARTALCRLIGVDFEKASMRNHHPCSGCGDMHCPGQCFLECEADYPEDEPTTSTLTYADLLAKYGSQLTEVHGDPFLKRDAA